MAKLGSFIKNTRAVIDKLEYGGEPRPYLGMSGLGHHCFRYSWLSFHWAQVKKHNARIARIFDAGHLFEPMLIKQLKEAGLDVYKIIDGKKLEHFGQPDEEQEEYIGFAGHAKGHSDGRCSGVIEAPQEEHTLEAKTMNDAKFKEVCKGGVKKANPTYYSQMQRYMRANGTRWSLFVAINKNDCYLYIERVPYVEKDAQDLVRKEQMIIMTDIVPHNEYDKDFYKCSYCDKREVCHGEQEPEKNCRTCEHCDIEDNGKWSCAWKDRKFLSTEEQRLGCKYYQKGWGL